MFGTEFVTIYGKDVGMVNFNTQAICEIIGITRRQVQYWDESDFIKPSVRQASGHGSTRLYSFFDLIQMRVAKTLMEGGISLQKIRKSLKYLRIHAPTVKNPLGELKFLTDGKGIFVLTADTSIIEDTLKNGQLVFALALGNIVKELSQNIQRFIVKKDVVVEAGGERFNVIVEADPEKGGFKVKCPSLNPHSFSSGETEEEALEMIKGVLVKGIVEYPKHEAV